MFDLSLKRIVVLLWSTFAMHIAGAQVRQDIDFNKGWKFYLGNDDAASKNSYDDSGWQSVNVPHDWSIGFAFSNRYAATPQGGALPGGIGWYRKTFYLPQADKNKNVQVKFDGVYRNSEVWINGHYLGRRPNGYVSFNYDLTPWLKFGNDKNVIAVKVDNNDQPNSRWYTGSGIYRDVNLAIFSSTHIYDSTLFITTPRISENTATVNVSAQFTPVKTGIPVARYKISVLSSKGKKIKAVTGTVERLVQQNRIDHNIDIEHPILWDIDNPYLYTLNIELFDESDHLLDIVSSSFGIRSIYFDREKGFFLNDRSLKIKGVCLHHDLGALGAAFNCRAAERQLQLLKNMGCNAIRTAHNPPAAAFLDLCDKMGFLVMDEAFDMWQKKKNKFDYALDFAEWHKRDLKEMVLRDRNHPSVFMWSVGNEIREQFDSSGTDMTKELVSIVKALDSTRPVTAALTELDTSKNFIYQAKALDVTGWNYNHEKYPAFLKNYPGQKFIASETNSALATRGHYDMPADSLRTLPAKGEKFAPNVNGNWTVSAYDNAVAYWGGTHEDTWKTIKKYDFLSGLFVWTGFDYLGEPTPYPWPARSAYFGIIDLAGFPKDIYYMYQSEWTSKPVLHIFPHWNWEPGKVIDVVAYYNNADEVELFLNGRSLGIKKKMNDDLHVTWRVPFEPGTLKAVSRRNNRVVLTKEVKTAGKPAKIELRSDRNSLTAGCNDLAFVTARVLDKDGNLVPNADNLISFTINGDAMIVGTDNGYQADTTSLASPLRKAWKGMALAIVRASSKKGNNTLFASSAGLPVTSISLKVND